MSAEPSGEPGPFAGTSLSRKRKRRGINPGVIYLLAAVIGLAGAGAYFKLSAKGGPIEQREEGRPSLSEAETCLRNDGLECAEADYKAYLKLYPNDAQTNARLAMTLTRDGRHKEALPYYKKARDLGVSAYDFDASYAETLDATGDVDGAIAMNRESLKLVPNLVDVREHLADELVRKGRPQEAIDLLESGDRDFAERGYGPYFTEKIAQIKARMGQAPAATDALADDKQLAGVTEIALHPRGGVLAVPVVIDDAVTLDFAVDSGSADVTLPAGVVRELTRKGLIRPGDYRGYRTAIVADGRQIQSQVFNIRSLKVGGRELKNVIGSVSGENGEALLGQTFLRRFKSWSIDNHRRVLVLTN